MELQDKDEKQELLAPVHGSNAGWFSDNNFVAEAGRVYTIKYTSFSRNISINELN